MAVSVPEFVQKVLDASGLTQTDLGRKTGIGQGTISKWLAGTQSPNLVKWEKLLAFVAKTRTTKHLVAVAPDLSLDAMVAPYGAAAEVGARLLLEAYLKTLPQP